MSQKKYPWKPRHAKLSHRGRREGRKPRNLAAEEHLAREVYDELRSNSPHEHIENPCYGLDPKKVREGQCGSAAYRRTARALIDKTILRAYLASEGLNLYTGIELVPLLRKCTAPEDGHIDWPKVVRHIVGLYYIAHIDPLWLFDSLPFAACSGAQRDANHYFSDVLSFYLFSPRAIRSTDSTKPIKLDWVGERQIFQMVERKLRHIIQCHKDSTDRANWNFYKGDNKDVQKANRANLFRLYGGDPIRKLERDALNDLRNSGELKTATLKPEQISHQRQRVKQQYVMESRLAAAREDAAKIAGLLERCERELLVGEGNAASVQKREKELVRLKKWQEHNARDIKSKSRKLRIAERRVANGKIPFFHKLEELKANNSDRVERYVQEYGCGLRYYLDMPTLINKNYKAGQEGHQSMFELPLYNEHLFLPHSETTFYSVILMGALKAKLYLLCDSHNVISIKAYAHAHQVEIREELSQHGIIRNFVLDNLKALYEQDELVIKQLEPLIENLRETKPEALRRIPYYHALMLLGIASPNDIVKLGDDFLKKSRKYYRSICKLNILGYEEYKHAHAVYRSILDHSDGALVSGVPARLDADDARELRELAGWSDEDLACYGYSD